MMIDLETLEAAAELVYRVVPPTPQYCWPLLSRRVGAEIWVKHENHTPIGAFKLRGGLVLIGRRHVRTNNSWMHNCKSLVKGRDRATLMMHPSEASRLGLVDEQKVRITTRVGTIEAPLECTNDIMPGVVSLPHGYGHATVAEHMRTAGATPGPNINAVTDDLLLEPLTGTAVLGGVPVVVESVAHAAAPGPEARAPIA